MRKTLCAALFAGLLGPVGCKDEHAVAIGDAQVEDVAPASRVQILASPADGDVKALVRQGLAATEGQGRRLVVYVGAIWCEPCRRFHVAAAAGELDSQFPRLTLLEFDLDRDRDRLKAAGYAPAYIPLFALPREDGSASGKQVEGGIKGEGAVSFVSARLQSLLAP